jgi:protein-tyrosine kinase
MKNNTLTQLPPPVSMLAAVEKNSVNDAILKARDQFGSTLITLSQPNSPQSEALRSLRSQLLLRWFNLGNKSLAIVGANLGDGCSYVSANLAITFAQLGMRTLLIDANLRDPTQHRLFNLKNEIGLSDILSGHTGQVVIDPLGAIDNLSILGAGAVSAHSQQLLSRTSFTELIKQTIAQYDVVLADTAPVMLSADAQAAAAACSGVVLVSRLNHTKLAHLTEMRNQLAITSAKIVGSVINEF